MKFELLITTIEKTSNNLQKRALSSVNQLLVIRNWLIGYYLVEFEQNGEDRAKYGKKLLETIESELKKKKIKGMSATNLRLFRLFYNTYPQIHQPVADELLSKKIQPLAEELKLGKRQIESLLLERIGLSNNKNALLKSIQSNQKIEQIEDTIKDPYILEFTGFKELPAYSKNDLETALLNKIQDFLIELGNGFCFEARQKRI